LLLFLNRLKKATQLVFAHGGCCINGCATVRCRLLCCCAGSNVTSVAEDEVMRMLVMFRNFIPAHEQIKE
jgi:phosphoglycerate dehydrogenase-like enzyme